MIRLIALSVILGWCADAAAPVMEKVGLRSSAAVRSVVVRPDTLRLEVGDTSPVTCEPRNGANGTGALLANRCSWSSSNTAIIGVLAGKQSARLVAKRTGTAFVTAAVKGKRDTVRVAVVTLVSGGSFAPLAEDPFVPVVDVQPSLLTVTPTSTATQRTLQGHCRDPITGPILTPWTWASRNTAVVAAIVSTKSAVTLTPVADGTVYVVGACEGEADSSFVTVSGVTPPDPPVASCPTSGYLRLVNVSTKAQRDAAIANALPGDQIRLAAGTYTGGTGGSVNVTITRSGTEANRITMCGPEDAVFDLNTAGNFRLHANYWTLLNFRITEQGTAYGMHIGPDASTASNHHNVIRGMEIDNGWQELLAINGSGHHNDIDSNYFHHSGRGTGNAEEGIYVCESDNSTDCLGNRIRWNRFECIGTEHVDLKGGADSTTVEGNYMDGRCEQGPDTLQTRVVSGNAVSILSVASSHNRIVYDTIIYGSPHAIQLWKTGLGWSTNSQVDSNRIQLFNRLNQSAPRAINASVDVTFKTCRDNIITDLVSGGAKYGGDAVGVCTP